MPTGSEAKIFDTILNYVRQIVLDPTLSVSYPGVKFDPSIGVPYLSLSLIPNTSDLSGFAYDSEVEHKGIIQLSVFWPSSQGLIKPMQVASQLVSSFTSGSRITKDNVIVVLIEEHPRIAPAIQETNWLQVPVIIRWRVVASKT